MAFHRDGQFPPFVENSPAHSEKKWGFPHKIVEFPAVKDYNESHSNKKGDVSVLNIVLVIFEDRCVFPTKLEGYAAYQATTPFLLPSRQSIRACVRAN